TMSNWAAATWLSLPLLTSPTVRAVPKYRPSASARPRRAVAPCAGRVMPSAVTVTVAAATMPSTNLVLVPMFPLLSAGRDGHVDRHVIRAVVAGDEPEHRRGTRRQPTVVGHVRHGHTRPALR